MNPRKNVGTAIGCWLLLLSSQLIGVWGQLPISVSAPYSETINGIPSEKQPVTVTLTDSLDKGFVRIGPQTVDLRGLAPRAIYIKRKVGALPIYMVVFMAKACLTTDDAQFLELNNRNNSYVSSVDPTMLRLLQNGRIHDAWEMAATGLVAATLVQNVQGFLDVISGAAAGYAIYQNIQQQKQIGQLVDNVNGLNKDIQTINTTIGILVDNIDNNINIFNEFKQLQNAANLKILENQAQHTSSISSLSTISEATVNNTDRLRLALLDVQQNQLDIANNTRALSNSTDIRFAEVRDAINANAAAAAANTDLQVGAVANAARAEFQRVYDTMELDRARTAEDNREKADIDLEQSNQIQTILQLFHLTLYQVQSFRQIRQVLWAQLAAMPQELRPMVAAGGIPPENPLRPENRRVWYDTYKVNTVLDGGGGVPYASSSTYELYADADQAMDRATSLLTRGYIIKNFGPNNCTRPYVGRDNFNNLIPESPGLRNTSCGFWLEHTTQTCMARFQNFTWLTADPTKAPNQQFTDVHPSFCMTPIVTTVQRVYRNFADWMDYVARFDCDVTLLANNETVIHTVQSNRINVFTRNRTHCYGNVPQMIPRTASSPMGVILNEMAAGIPAFVSQVTATDVRKHGRLMAGFRFETSPYQFTPTFKDEDGNYKYDGGTDGTQCVYASYTAASKQMVDVYSIIPKTSNLFQKTVFINSVFVNDTTGLNYDPREEPVTTEVSLETMESQHLLPQSAILIGNPLTDPYVYDVPGRLCDLSPDPLARQGTAFELLAKPGTTVTPTYEDYYYANGPRFTGGIDSVSLHSYAFRTVTGSDGYRYCDVTGGYPLNGTVGLDSRAFSPGQIPNGVACQLMKLFKLEEVNAGGQTELHMMPRKWRYSVRLEGASGKVATEFNSFCVNSRVIATPPLARLELSTNPGQGNATVDVVITASNPADLAACGGQSGIKYVPAYPGVKNVDLDVCPTMNISIYRIDRSPVTGRNVRVLCEQIAADSVAESIAEYSGVAVDVVTAIDTRTSIVSQTLAEADRVQQRLLIRQAEAQSAFVVGDDSIRQQIQEYKATIETYPVNTSKIISKNLTLTEGITRILEVMNENIQNNTAKNLALIADAFRTPNITQAFLDIAAGTRNSLRIQSELQPILDGLLAVPDQTINKTAIFLLLGSLQVRPDLVAPDDPVIRGLVDVFSRSPEFTLAAGRAVGELLLQGVNGAAGIPALLINEIGKAADKLIDKIPNLGILGGIGGWFLDLAIHTLVSVAISISIVIALAKNTTLFHPSPPKGPSASETVGLLSKATGRSGAM